ncbi:hypothetical protein G6F62_009477 [Rhizopus arrhizus]|nr:hypothetical protein G6F62_009477 [Rhizopus arrhizus]
MITDQLTTPGPLNRVWLACHMEKRLSKSQFLQTNIEKTIDAIETNQEEEPLTLRISGQLLLGVVRIYSRKTRYLLEDCNEALVKIKLAFKSGDVNMPDISHSIASVNTITLQDKLTEFDILLPDVPLNANLNEIDPILDNLDISASQDITLSELQTGFSFGALEFGRGAGGFDTTEAGRRDQAGFAETAFEPTEIAEPFKGMSLDDATGLADNTAGFDFDLNDNLDYGADVDVHEAAFNPPIEADASLDTLMQVGIMPVDEQLIFDTESVHEPTVRKRKRLIVDKVTEIPQEDLRRYNSNTSSIVNKDIQFFETAKAKIAINLRGPSGEALGTDLENMFSKISRKRRASALEAHAQGETYLGAPTPAGEGLEPFEGFNDYDVDIDTGDFDRERFNQFQRDTENISVENGSFDSQTDESLHESTRRTFETIENHMQFNGTVKFADFVVGFKR